jgi:hypothetical protein
MMPRAVLIALGIFLTFSPWHDANGGGGGGVHGANSAAASAERKVRFENGPLGMYLASNDEVGRGRGEEGTE